MARIREIATLAGLSLVGCFGAVGLVAVGVAIAIGIFAMWSGLIALVLWAVWNWTAPALDFIPEAYKHMDFMVVWGIVAVLRLIRGVVFDKVVKKAD